MLHFISILWQDQILIDSLSAHYISLLHILQLFVFCLFFSREVCKNNGKELGRTFSHGYYLLPTPLGSMDPIDIPLNMDTSG